MDKVNVTILFGNYEKESLLVSAIILVASVDASYFTSTDTIDWLSAFHLYTFPQSHQDYNEFYLLQHLVVISIRFLILS